MTIIVKTWFFRVFIFQTQNLTSFLTAVLIDKFAIEHNLQQYKSIVSVGPPCFFLAPVIKVMLMDTAYFILLTFVKKPNGFKKDVRNYKRQNA